MSRGSRRKAMKKMAREQQKRDKKINSMQEKINPITAGWMFNKWYEKVILISLMALGMWKLFEVIFF